MFTEHILCARHGDKHFTHTLEFHVTLSPYHNDLPLQGRKLELREVKLLVSGHTARVVKRGLKSSWAVSAASNADHLAALTTLGSGWMGGTGQERAGFSGVHGGC